MKVVAKQYINLVGVLSEGQYSEIVTPIIFTSTEGGDFLLSVASATNGNAGTAASFNWADPIFGNQMSPSLGDSGPNQPLFGAFLVHLGPGGQISSYLQVNSDAPISSVLYITVVDLAAPGL